MEGPRAPLDKEYSNIISFLDKNLRPQVDWSIANEYPTTFSEENKRNIRVISEEGNIVSHAVWKPVLIRTPQAVYKFAEIGSVVTEEKHRKQGHSLKILESCLESAVAEDCDFAILWTDMYDFYRKMGFELAGSEYCAVINGPLVEKASGKYKIKEGSNIDPEAILKVFQKHTVSTVRTTAELRKYLAIPNSRVYTAWAADGTLAAYAVEGKGADLQGYIHEWGGSLEALHDLVSHVWNQQQRQLFWLIPRHSQNLIRNLNERGVVTHHGLLGMVKVLNPVRFAGKVQKYLRGALRRTDINVSMDKELVVIQTSFSKISFTQQEFTQYVFGPKVPQVATLMDQKDFEPISNSLPLPLWIWGWDSI